MKNQEMSIIAWNDGNAEVYYDGTSKGTFIIENAEVYPFDISIELVKKNKWVNTYIIEKDTGNIILTNSDIMSILDN